jgi:NAD(P)-dependent dehydrogenase (short-subunit alcohol dehydrogenase family)
MTSTAEVTVQEPVTADLLASPPVLPGITPETVVLITGGSGAIGSRTAAVLSAIGARVTIMARSPERVAQAAAEAQQAGQVLGAAGDISVPDDITRVVTQTVREFGRLDALVNLAAVGDSGGALADLTLDEIDTVLGTNLRGALVLARESAWAMRDSGGGSIVNVASIAAHRVTPGRLVYGPSKAALIYLTRQLAAELGPYGIRANSISPGQTPTALRKFSDPAGADNAPSSIRSDRPTQTKRIPLGRRGTLDDYVGAILFLVSGLSAYVTGTDLLVDGGAAILR